MDQNQNHPKSVPISALRRFRTLGFFFSTVSEGTGPLACRATEFLTAEVWAARGGISMSINI